MLARFANQPTPSTIPKVTPKRYTLGEQRAIFETFVALAHSMSARKVRRAEATLTDDGQAVVLLFSHDDFPDARFGYLAKAPTEDDHEDVWLAEELATGALHRIMRDVAPVPDAAGVTWLRLDGQLLRADSERRDYET